MTTTITETEMRQFLQFETDDFPKSEDFNFFITLAEGRVGLDFEGTDTMAKWIATLLIGRHFILRSLASKALSKGYIQATAEGRTVTKAYQEFVLEAEKAMQEYKEFIVANGRREATRVDHMTDTTEISSATRQEFIDIMLGKTNASNSETARKYDYFWRR